MDQIFILAPSMSPLMLPVVSRQKTTSTLGLAGFLASSARAGRMPLATRTAARKAARTPRGTQEHCMDETLQGKQLQDYHSRLDDWGRAQGCNGCVTMSFATVPAMGSLWPGSHLLPTMPVLPGWALRRLYPIACSRHGTESRPGLRP